MTQFVKPPGAWFGFDIVERAISWCQGHITSRYPNFSFEHTNVFNAKYNPSGTVRSGEFTFPYATDSFDLVYLTSVFTHMLPPDVERYTSEIGRVLRPGGRAFLTYFLLNDQTESQLANGAATLSFDVELAGARAHSAASPEAAIAYAEGDVRGMLERAGLTVRGPIHLGNWSGRGGGLTYQDVVLADKSGDRVTGDS
jgi:SAM-dependent methyltransferase